MGERRGQANFPQSATFRSPKPVRGRTKFIFWGMLGLLILLGLSLREQKLGLRKDADLLPPLVMLGGDPYVRALMRTISASEASDANPYTLLYGGKHVQDLSRHPD